MKNMYLLILGLLLTFTPADLLQADDATTEMKRIGAEVAALKIGLGDYFLGHKINELQKEIAKKNAIEKTIKGSYKFNDAGIFVIAAIDTDMVIGLYKENTDASEEEVKYLVGELMMQFEEPTAMAHDKLIYWAFGKEGRIPQDLFDAARQSGGSDVLVTVKFSSDQPIIPTSKPVKETKDDKDEAKDVETPPTSIYVVISSNPLSQVFLAQNK